MQIEPFVIPGPTRDEDFRFVHAGPWDPRQLERCQRVLLRTNNRSSRQLFGHPVEWCIQCDSDLHFHFAVRQGGEFIGCWGLLEAEWANPEQTRFRAYSVPGVREIMRDEWPALRRVNDWLLDNPLPLVGGGRIRLARVKRYRGPLKKYGDRLHAQMPRKE